MADTLSKKKKAHASIQFIIAQSEGGALKKKHTGILKFTATIAVNAIRKKTRSGRNTFPLRRIIYFARAL